MAQSEIPTVDCGVIRSTAVWALTIHYLTIHNLFERLTDQRRALRDRDSGCLECSDLVCGSAFAARNDGPGVAHATARRCSAAGDESDHGFLDVRLDVRGGFLLGRAADLADHDNSVSFGIFVEEPQDIDERRPDDGVTADTDASGLADAKSGELAHCLIRQCPASGNHTYVSLPVDVSRHDANLTFSRRDNSGAVGADKPGLSSRE